ncbi:MAG: cyclic nucleotide-binding domain-containing protein [Gemmataceae bacterium]
MPDPVTTPPEDDGYELVGPDTTSNLSSDEDDVLVRKERATAEQFKELIEVVLDGYAVTVPKAVPKTDSAGAELRDATGKLIPRATTVYDAGRELVRQGRWTETELRERLPVLCHVSHLNPVAVCRVCSVHVVKVKKGTKRAERKLFPACHLEVSTGLEVTTRLGAERHEPEKLKAMPEKEQTALGDTAKKVQKSVSLVVEMLYADHKPETIRWQDGGKEYKEGKRYENELQAVAARLGVTKVRDRLRRPEGAFSRNRMAEDIPSDTDPNRPHTKPLRRIPLDLLAPTAPGHETLSREADAAWAAWNRLVDDRFPYSSRTVVVDHDKCILCDRCVRSCSEVKPFQVIGHTGKGYATRVSFDLDFLMGPRARADGQADPNLAQSTCVQCGECMTSCPTGALSLRRRVQPRAWDDSPDKIPQNPNTPFPEGGDFLTAEEVRNIRVYYVPPGKPADQGRVIAPFASVPFAYLKWNEGAVRRWVIKPGQRKVLAWGGEYDTTAFLLTGTGKFNAYETVRETLTPGWIGRLLGKEEQTVVKRELGPKINANPIPGTVLLLGEMAPLTQKARNATIEVFADPDEPGRTLLEVSPGEYVAPQHPDASRDVVVYEVTRNMLDMFLRVRNTRQAVREVYQPRALERGVAESKLLTGSAVLAGLPENERRAVTDFLVRSGKLAYISAAPGEVLLAEGERAQDFYFIRIGNVELYKTVSGRKQVLGRLGDGDCIGEIALLGDELKEAGILPQNASTTRRQATVAAIDPVELVRVPGGVFDGMCDRFPQVKELLFNLVRLRLNPPKAVPAELTPAYVSQGLFQGQKMLVLDLKSCTRCDECTRACADTHGGNPRLLRDGMRFGDFLVATSCRSCHKPYCMDGCPVDAIHRKGTRLEVLIESHCIGCGLCERNCPYGSIHMVPLGKPGGAGTAVVARQAANCDLCASVGGKPFCVNACPHHAAFRWDGDTLRDAVAGRMMAAKS